MSLALRRALGANFLTTLTFFLVLGNLVPIAWMVYCSFKDNNEILSGAVMPGRRHNDVTFAEALPGGFLVGTQDGGVNLLDPHLALKKHADLGTFATSYSLQGDTLWVLSSNRGLQAMSTSNLEVIADYPVEAMAKAYGNTWKTLWVNDVAASSLVRVQGDLYLAYLFVDFPGVLRFSPQHKIFVPVTPLATAQIGAIRQMSGGAGDTLSLLTSKGYYRFAMQSSAMAKVMPSPALIPGDISRFADLKGSYSAFLRGKTVLIYHRDGDSVACSMGEEEGLGTSVVSALGIPPIGSSDANRIWVGNSQAVISIEMDSSRSACTVGQTRHPSYTGAEYDEDNTDVTGAETTTLLALADGTVLAGGTRGALALTAQDGKQQAFFSLPKPPFYFQWRNFVDLWRYIDFGRYLFNSFIVCGSVMIIAMVLASLGGYALARYDFPGRSTFGYSVLATQMIPGIMLLLPIYLMYVNIAKHSGLVIKGTYLGLILTYAAYFVPFSIWILRGFFASIPKELEEAALIDGCGPFKAFFRIIVPSAMPGIVATGVYVFLSAWDELMFAWVLTSEKTYTIPVGIRLFVGNFQNRYDLMMAAATVSTLPVMFLFFLMQKQIVSGLTAGAVKD